MFIFSKIRLSSNPSYVQNSVQTGSKICVRAKTIKLLEANTGIKLHDLECGDGFLDMTSSKVQQANKNPSKPKAVKIFKKNKKKTLCFL